MVWNETEYGLVKDIRWEQIHVLLSLTFLVFQDASIKHLEARHPYVQQVQLRTKIFETFTLKTLLYVFYRYLIRENIFIGNINGNNIVMLQRERGV